MMPICEKCIYCHNLKKIGNRCELDCSKNPNVGAVGINYQRCPSYCNSKIGVVIR